ncbi:hypothetical protein LCGC14_0538050 [marine sediment metagenome]|uniref:Uncharacterized protein n=1 Tax=marine sediment metagenome TaxID=412755 RepID=A0A0F9SC20_9ZZZZ
MTKYYEKIESMRKFDKEWVKAQEKAESSLGMDDSYTINENGMVTRFINCDQADAFHNYVRNMKEEVFNVFCEMFFLAIKVKDKVEMFKALTIFDEMDNYNLGNPSMRRRLKRIREATHEVSYQF